MSWDSIASLLARRSSGDSNARVELGASPLQQHQIKMVKSNIEGRMRMKVSTGVSVGGIVPLGSLILILKIESVCYCLLESLSRRDNGLGPVLGK
jgi:hypothetical protein